MEKSIGPVNGDLVLRGDSVIVESLRGKLGDGVVNISGYSILLQGGRLDVNLKIKARNASFVITDLVDVNLNEADLIFKTDGNGYLLKGIVKLGETRFIRNVRITNLVKTNQVTPAAPSQQNQFMQSTKLEVEVQLRDNFYVDMNLATMQLGGQVAISGTGAKLGFVGEVNVIEGYVNYLDRPFTIKKATFSNYDPFKMNPSIDLIASSDVVAYAAGTAQTVSYTINLTIRGDVEHLSVALTSAPPLSEPDIISVLTLGTTLGAVGSDLAGRIGSLVGQEIIGLGTKKLERVLDLQSISVSGNIFNPSTQNGPEVTLTKRFTNRLTVSYTSGLTGLYQQKVLALFRIFPFLFFIGETDDFGNANINLRFRANR